MHVKSFSSAHFEHFAAALQNVENDFIIEKHQSGNCFPLLRLKLALAVVVVVAGAGGKRPR